MATHRGTSRTGIAAAASGARRAKAPRRAAESAPARRGVPLSRRGLLIGAGVAGVGVLAAGGFGASKLLEGAWQAPQGMYGPVTQITRVTGGVPLREGWNGTRVRVLQVMLGIVRTGSHQTYDEETMEAVRSVQSAAGLNPDGVCGPETWQEIAPDFPFTMDAWQTPVRAALDWTRAQRIDEFVRFAESCIGAPYTWGGAGWKRHEVAGYDCSGLVLQSLYSAGLDPEPITVIHHAEPSYRSSQMLAKDTRLTSVPIEKRERGDIVFYRDQSGSVVHCSIVREPDSIVQATGADVHISEFRREPGSGYVALDHVKRPFA